MISPSRATKRYFLRHATIYMFPIGLLLNLGEAFLNARTDELPFVAGLPLAASAILGVHVVRNNQFSSSNDDATLPLAHQRRTPRRGAMDKATLMAFDVMLGSILLLMAFASWFVLQLQVADEQRLLAQAATLPLILGFAIHYFLAFASMEEVFLTGQCTECEHCHSLNRFTTREAALPNDDLFVVRVEYSDEEQMPSEKQLLQQRDELLSRPVPTIVITSEKA